MPQVQPFIRDTRLRLRHANLRLALLLTGTFAMLLTGTFPISSYHAPCYYKHNPGDLKSAHDNLREYTAPTTVSFLLSELSSDPEPSSKASSTGFNINVLYALCFYKPNRGDFKSTHDNCATHLLAASTKLPITLFVYINPTEATSSLPTTISVIVQLQRKVPAASGFQGSREIAADCLSSPSSKASFTGFNINVLYALCFYKPQPRRLQVYPRQLRNTFTSSLDEIAYHAS